MNGVNKMKIEVWSDYVCPFCYIGKRLLEQALETFPHRDQVEVVYKSFELHPGVENNPNMSINELIANKYGMPIEQAEAMNQQVIQRAAEVGLNYNFDQMKQTNTVKSHRLTKYAETKGKGGELTERLLSAHFVESKFLGDDETLLLLAAEVGLDQTEVEHVLSSDAFLEEVLKDQAEGQQLGVQGVPFFVLNRKYGISGAQPLEVFTQTLEKVWEEENATSPLQQITTSKDGTCTDGSCEV